MKTKYNPSFIVFGFIYGVGLVGIDVEPLIKLTFFVVGMSLFFYGIKLRYLAKKGIENTKK